MVDRKILSDSVSALPAPIGLAANGMMVQAAPALDRKERMSLLFQLNPPANKTADLEARVARGEVLKPEEVKAIYAPAAGSSKQLTDWLTTQGFAVSNVSDNGAAIYAAGEDRWLPPAAVAQMNDALSQLASGPPPSTAAPAPTAPVSTPGGPQYLPPQSK